MSDQYLGELRLVGFNFAPIGWAPAQGQLLPISRSTALFALLGVMYGGDGKSNFALPNLQGNVAVGVGQGPGLSLYDQGQTGGSQNVTLMASETPPHGHPFNADGRDATTSAPGNSALAKTTTNNVLVYATSGRSQVQLSPNFLAPFGGNQPHNNMMPYLTLNWVIAMTGIFPARP